MSEVEKLIAHAKMAIQQGEKGMSKLHSEGAILAIDGMSGNKTRHFYNRMLELEFPGRSTNYLEVGVWKGSSFVSAMYGNNHVKACAIDNWCEFGGPKNAFHDNINKYLSSQVDNIRVLEKDCFKVTASEVEFTPFDIYLYDGGHQEEEHKQAITYMKPFLADTSIVLVDDWNWECVKKGTHAGFTEAGMKVLFAADVGAGGDSDRAGFWNGCGVFVVQK